MLPAHAEKLTALFYGTKSEEIDIGFGDSPHTVEDDRPRRDGDTR